MNLGVFAMLDNSLKLYQKHLEQSMSYTSGSIDSYCNDLQDYTDFLCKNYSIENPDQITHQHIRNYLARLKRKDHTPSSVGRKMSAIRSFHKFLLQQDLIERNVSIEVSLPKRTSKPPFVLSVEEIDALLLACDQDNPLDLRNRAMIEVLYGCGLRISELLTLRLRDLHLNMGFINIHGNNKKERLIPIGFEAAYALKQYIDKGRVHINKTKEDIVFVNTRGYELSRVGFFKTLKQIALKAGIASPISPQTLRHTFAFHMLENGVELKVLQDLLGHEDISSTYIYKHLQQKNNV